MNPLRAISFLLLAALAPVAAESPDFVDSPWLKPRSLQDFRALLDRSPFSLPTAEETLAAEERYFLTGAATINDIPVVFVFDKNTQDRFMLKKLEGPESSNQNRLIELAQATDPKNLSAKIFIEGRTTEIRFSETSFAPSSGMPPQGFAGPPQPGQLGQPGQPGQFGQPGQTAQYGMPNPGFPQNPAPGGPPGMQPPQQIQNNAAIQPGQPDPSEPPRRVIRRRVISNSQPDPGP
jgi:hypothetical protein